MRKEGLPNLTLTGHIESKRTWGETVNAFMGTNGRTRTKRKMGKSQKLLRAGKKAGTCREP